MHSFQADIDLNGVQERKLFYIDVEFHCIHQLVEEMIQDLQSRLSEY